MKQLAGKDVEIYATSSEVYVFNAETIRIDSKTYQIADEAKRVIASGIDDLPHVFIDGGRLDKDWYQVDYINGIITLNEAVSDSAEVTVAYYYYPMVKVASAHVANYIEAVDLHDVTRFGDAFKRRMKGLKYASGSLSMWDIEDTTFTDALTNGKPVFIQVKPSATSKHQVKLFAYLESTEMQAAVDSPQEQTVSFISTGEMMNEYVTN